MKTVHIVTIALLLTLSCARPTSAAPATFTMVSTTTVATPTPSEAESLIYATTAPTASGPMRFIINFLTNIVGAISPIAWPLFGFFVVVDLIGMFFEVRQKRGFPWLAASLLLVSFIICYFIANSNEIATWLREMAGT